MFDLNDDLIRNAVAYHQSTLRTGSNRRLDVSLVLVVRRTVGGLCIRIGQRLQGDAAAVSGAAGTAVVA